MKDDQINIHRKWPTPEFDPATKIHKTDKSYKRHNEKKAIEDALQEAEDENTDLDFGY